MTLILASGSPRRRELVKHLGVPYEIVPSRIEEREPRAGESPAAYAESLAREKACDVAGQYPGAVVLGADTVVVIADRILGKPKSVADAVRMLQLLRGRWHQVVTGVAVVRGGTMRSGASLSHVHLREASDDELHAYVESGEPMDKAGAYAIQGLGGTLVDGQKGCYNTVVGLPLSLVAELLQASGVSVAPIDCCASCTHRNTM